jgi:phage/plasmid-associated DNA primase
MPPTNKSNMSKPDLVLFEPISKRAVKWLLDNVDKAEAEWRAKVESILRKTLKACVDDHRVRVEYRRKIIHDGKSYGRLYSNHVGFQMMWSRFRGALAHHSMNTMSINLFDIDMKNAHPELLMQLAERHETAGEDAKFIRKYLERRDNILNMVCCETGCDRGAAKQLFLSILNYGSVEGWMKSNRIQSWGSDCRYRQFAEGFKIAFRSIAYRLMIKLPRLVEVARTSLVEVPDLDEFSQASLVDGSYSDIDLKKRFIHILLTSAEDDALSHACAYLNSLPSVDVVSYQYDGCVVMTEAKKEDIDLDLLSQYVHKHSAFYLTFDFKDFDDTVDIQLSRLIQNIKDVVDVLYEENEDAFHDIKYDPMSGFYYLYTNGVWRGTHYEMILKAVQDMVKNSYTMRCPGNEKHYNHFWVNSKQVCDLAVRTFCIEPGFTLKLDSSTTIFPFRNGCWDFTLQSFRELLRSDMVSKTTCWDYEPHSNQAPVIDYMEKVFPIEEERECVATYFAYMLSPTKHLKKMMMLTDVVDGNNGKSKLMFLLKAIMGCRSGGSPSEVLYVENKQIVMRDTSSNKNSHSAVVAELKGAYLFCGDELSSTHKLDTSFCKEASGGGQAVITGRHFHSKESFVFPVKFGMILSFNQGCMPDLGCDKVFYERLLMAKFRTKFVARAAGESDECFADRCSAFEYCFEQNNAIEDLMMTWRSAAFDYFVARIHNIHALDHPPKSFIDFRSELVKDDNVLVDWFEKHFEITGDPTDYVQVSEVHRYLSETNDGDLVKSAKVQKQLFELCLRTNGVVVHDKKKLSGNRVLRKVAVGVKFNPHYCVDAEMDL